MGIKDDETRKDKHWCQRANFSHFNSITNFLFSSFCRDFRPTSLEKGQELVRLRIYAIYAWGVPFVIMTIALILDNLPEGGFLQPNFGKTKCGFEGKLRATCIGNNDVWMRSEKWMNEICVGQFWQPHSTHTFDAIHNDDCGIYSCIEITGHATRRYTCMHAQAAGPLHNGFRRYWTIRFWAHT